MKSISKRLKMVFVAALVAEFLMIIAYETQTILEGSYAGDESLEFMANTAMILLTICLLPFALKMFTLAKVKNYMRCYGKRGLYHMAFLRLCLLIMPMLVNTLCYYLFMRAGFAYLAIVCFISLAFVTPTTQRCRGELDSVFQSE